MIQTNLYLKFKTQFDFLICAPSTANIVSGPKRGEVRKLEEENNLLKAKLELVMDMVSQKYYIYC